MVLPSHKFATLLLVGLGAATPAAALITCCDVDGKRVCGEPAPPQCLDRPKTVFNKGVPQKVEAPPTPEQRSELEAAAARKVEEERLAEERARRDQALLGSYTNEKEIDLARDRSLAEIEKRASQANARLETALKQQKQLELDREFYMNKPLPTQLQAKFRDNENEIAAQKKILQQRDPDIASIKTRFDADKARFRQITGGRRALQPPQQ